MGYNAATRTFDTISDLKGQRGTTNVKVTVLGYYTAGDGGGGIFYWNATSSAADNGGTIIQTTVGSGNGRWIREEIDNIIDVRWFGAKPDGNTDNTIFLNNCSAYIKTLAGQTRKPTMYFSAGEFNTGRINMSGVFNVRGNGIRTTVRGLAGQDVFYWPNPGESGYIAPTDTVMEELRIVINNAQDVSNNYVRIGLGGERIGNCAIHFPGVIGLSGFTTSNLIITTGGIGNNTCGIFCSGPLYKYNAGFKTDISTTDYGIIIGASELNTSFTSRAGVYDQATGTFNIPNTYANGDQIAIIFDENITQITGITPRTTVYYVTNVSISSFQISATVGGTAIVGALTGSTTVYCVPAGVPTIEYACDEWSWQHLITRSCGKVGLSVPNLAYATFGTWSCQARTVAFRILNFPSHARSFSNDVHFGHINTEGPTDGASTSREYIRIEGRHIYGKYIKCRGGSNQYITFNTFACIIDSVAIDGTNKIRVLGDNNDFRNLLSEFKETDIIDTGIGNRFTFSRDDSSSDNSRFAPMLSERSSARVSGGFYPDFLLRGSAQYLSDNALYYQAIGMLWQSGTPVLLFDDATLPINGYVRFTGTQTASIRYAYGSNRYPITLGKHYPKGKWSLYAYVRSVGGAQNITLGFQSIMPSGINATVTVNVGTAWQTVSLPLDHSAATDGMSAQFNLIATGGGTSTAFDVAYFFVSPDIIASNGVTVGTYTTTGDGLIGSFTIPYDLSALTAPQLSALEYTITPVTGPAQGMISNQAIATGLQVNYSICPVGTLTYNYTIKLPA